MVSSDSSLALMLALCFALCVSNALAMPITSGSNDIGRPGSLVEDTAFHLRLPKGLTADDVSAVEVNGRDGTVIVGQRGTGAPTVLFFNQDGEYLYGWGANDTTPSGIVKVHGLTVDPDFAHLWVADLGAHDVKRYTMNGTLVLTIGVPNEQGTDVDPLQFGNVAQIVVRDFIHHRGGGSVDSDDDNKASHTQTLFISDGDGGVNDRVLRLEDSHSGHLSTRWDRGNNGTLAGDFHSPHSLALDSAAGVVWVAVRENNSTEALHAETGEYIAELNQRCFGDEESTAWAVAIDSMRRLLYVNVAHTLLPGTSTGVLAPGKSRILVLRLDRDGNVVSNGGGTDKHRTCDVLQELPIGSSCPPGTAVCSTPHLLAVDTDVHADRRGGGVYVALLDTPWTGAVRRWVRKD